LGSLTELARYASRVAADVEARLGGEQAWNQLVGDQMQAGICQVNGCSRGICRVAIVLRARLV
jgi:glycerate kinase